MNKKEKTTEELFNITPMRKAMKARGISAEELATFLGVSITFVNLMVRGVSKVPKNRIDMICKKLGLTPDQLTQKKL